MDPTTSNAPTAQAIKPSRQHTFRRGEKLAGGAPRERGLSDMSAIERQLAVQAARVKSEGSRRTIVADYRIARPKRRSRGWRVRWQLIALISFWVLVGLLFVVMDLDRPLRNLALQFMNRYSAPTDTGSTPSRLNADTAREDRFAASGAVKRSPSDSIDGDQLKVASAQASSLSQSVSTGNSSLRRLQAVSAATPVKRVRKPVLESISVTSGMVVGDQFTSGDGGRILRVAFDYRNFPAVQGEESVNMLVVRFRSRDGVTLLSEVPVILRGERGTREFLIDTLPFPKADSGYQMEMDLKEEVIASRDIVLN